VTIIKWIHGVSVELVVRFAAIFHFKLRARAEEKCASEDRAQFLPGFELGTALLLSPARQECHFDNNIRSTSD